MVIERYLNYGRHVVEAFTAQVAPFESVLDLGAGSGDDLRLAKAASPQARCYAMESYAPNVERLRALGFEVSSGNLERDRLPFGDESLDLVIANQILEHVKEIFWILHEVSRTLKVGGHFLLGVPNLASLHNRLMLLAGLQPTSIQNHSAHVRGYTRHDLLRLFRMVFPGGFELKDFKGSNFYPFPAALAKPLAKIAPNAAVAIFLLLEKKKVYHGEFLKHPVQAQLETNYYLGEHGEGVGHSM